MRRPYCTETLRTPGSGTVEHRRWGLYWEAQWLQKLACWTFRRCPFHFSEVPLIASCLRSEQESVLLILPNSSFRSIRLPSSLTHAVFFLKQWHIRMQAMTHKSVCSRKRKYGIEARTLDARLPCHRALNHRTKHHPGKPAR